MKLTSQPIFMEASCCPIKYDCSHNSTATQTSKTEMLNDNGIGGDVDGKITKNRGNGMNCDSNLLKKFLILIIFAPVCIDNDRSYQEGERFPLNDERPCEVCYCIKGLRKCVVKKCAPVIHGCVPKVPAHGACCPTSYDCRRRSLKFKRHSRQENEDEEEEVEEDNDTIDFFSLLFGTDEPKEETATATAVTTTTISTLPPFKALPSTTESSFFDFIRAGLEAIDANADKIDAQINKVPEKSSAAAATAHDEEEEDSSETFETSTKIKTSSVPTTTPLKETFTTLPSTTKFSTTTTTPRSTSNAPSVKSEIKTTTTTSGVF